MAKTPAAKLLLDYLHLLTALDRSQPVLDLACGSGRNGLELAGKGVEVLFADHSAEALAIVEARLLDSSLPGKTWQVDLEERDIKPLAGRQFSAVLGFRYLHRPLFPALKEAVIPGGLVIYETFSTDNRRCGRPNNPNFLLHPGELKQLFEGWEILHYFEGILQNPTRAVAQIVARKPGH